MRKFSLWLPWVLLIIVVSSFFIWQKKHPAQDLTAADGVKMPSENQQSLVDQDHKGAITSYHNAVKLAAPAVVSIFTTQEVDNTKNPLMNDPVFRELFGNNNPYEQQEGESNLGSGVIVREDGYILTNNHVIEKSTQIVVALNDGRRVEAKVIGTDADTDLAVIKVDLKGLPVLPFKLSGNQVGDVVLAIGNPFGVGQTVTQGIISATERTDLGINTYENFIQTDAAINPGNSGGALIDVAGNLIGVNTAIFSRSGGSLGIGFAIPASVSKQVLDSILQHGYVVRGWLGVYIARKDQGQQKDMLAKQTGAQIAGVMIGGPAQEAGLQAGDVITKVNDEKVTSSTHLINYIALQQPNSKVRLVVKRGDEELSLDVVVGNRPSQESAKAASRQ
ncbi:MAG: trypsin-like peptidase domain-containing protein [Acinetobacter sp.]|nr:trypsin-like peptidase domain-containing protein [Acinetobacter sp.]